MSSYLSVDEIYEENKVLKEKIIELENQIRLSVMSALHFDFS